MDNNLDNFSGSLIELKDKLIEIINKINELEERVVALE
jgi:archaellum component FlaC